MKGDSHQERGIISFHDFRRRRVKIGYGVMVVMLLAVAWTMIYPFLVTIFNAFKTKTDIYTFPPSLLPKDWVWTNFGDVLKYVDLGRHMANTFLIFAGNMLFAVLFIGLAAFSLSHLKIPFRKGFTLFFMCTLMIPSATYMIPNYLNLQSLGLLNSYWAFWLPAAANAFWILLLKSFFDGIHKELFEAARMDGASEIRCFLQIAFPLSLPIIATILIFGFTQTWNEWYWAGVVITSPEKYPIASVIYKYVLSGETNNIQENVKFAILTIVMIPPLMIFAFLQKYIIRGVNLSSVKG
ncbi:sugar ABC transporter permease [Paenibacillus faecis]|uniref:carbohydrate ABC transporter permease n=1 Tax=Paenibacillus faecis TaxID=862114 RepID=UPI001B2478F6|nr:carbohydrate ABC transporter permease [Paenibacillus faecis]GIO85112.1 sugar ABC transporter permease [Paenibacillus faecis]